mgnify:CR=1 FL=1
MNEEYDDHLDQGVELELVGQTPRYLFAGYCTKDAFDFGSGQTPITYSFGMSTEEQKAGLFPKSGRGKDEPLTRSSFKGQYFYEAWIGKGQLVGLCEISVSGTRFTDDTHMTLTLQAIYVKPRFRRKGICRGLCELGAEREFERILTVVLSAPDRDQRAFKLNADAELHSEGGQAAIQEICSNLELTVERLLSVQDLDFTLETETENW